MNTRSLASCLFRLACVSFALWQVYRIWTGEISVILGIGFVIAMLLLVRSNLLVSGKLTPVDTGNARDLSIQSAPIRDVTPDFVARVLGDEHVIHVMKLDLMKTGLIGHKEVWQLGLIAPDQDRFDPRPGSPSLQKRLARFFRDPNTRANSVEQVPLKRTAELHARSFSNLLQNRILITGGAPRLLLPGYSAWSYRLNTELSQGEFMSIRDIQVRSSSRSGEQADWPLPRFLREQGFPLKAWYEDGDPLTTERGGTIVIDSGRVIVIYPQYFLQRRFVDDEGDLVYTGLDENLHSIVSGVSMRPSVSEGLIRSISLNRYTPILRYRSFPYASDFMLPLLDTPMSCSGWADLFIDTRGMGKLYVAREKSEAEWREMMNRLQQLFFSELAKKDYHLLGLTKDREHLNQYLSRKQEILEDYFIIRDWQLP